MRSNPGFVLVTVLLLTIASWAMLAAMLSIAFLHYRLALGAERGAVAGAAAERAVAHYLTAAGEARRRDGVWPTPTEPPSVDGCSLDLIEMAQADGWWRVRVRGSFEGAQAWREGSVHAPP